jgi:predicted DNA-binding transcriptional regulator AlpA
MTTQSFTLTLTGPSIVEDDAILERLYAAGCSDASFGERDDRTYADFDREAASLGDAIVSAIQQIESVPGIGVKRVEEQDLVAISDIAERTGRSRQNIWQMTSGERGNGDFPLPAATFGNDRSLWRWSDVADWLRARGIDLPGSTERAHLIGAINAVLDARNHMTHVDDAIERSNINRLAMVGTFELSAVRTSVGHSVIAAATHVLLETCTVASVGSSTSIPADRDNAAAHKQKRSETNSYSCAA